MLSRNMSMAIKKGSIPYCRNCKHYRLEGPLHKRESSICKLFERKCIITGIKRYDSIFDCRMDETKCGKGGTLYSEIQY